ncbi:MAG: tRNA (adenosine(37)-N6)-threonylcarbamoyltransferase complex ATPase subunit type 1 TsaE [Candidatus Saccharimonadales bacterium]
MSTEEIWQTQSKSLNETELLGEKIGRRLKGGETIELVSDLGGGKTTLVRGLAKGMGSLDRVASPSFTIKRQYYTEDLELHHFDFHRLQSPGEIQHDLAEVINNPSHVVVVEWADMVQGVLPAERLTITIKPTGQTSRSISLKYPKQLAYAVEDAK